MTTPAAAIPVADSIVFVDAHRPTMEAGTYDITLTQHVTGLQTAPLKQRARVHVLGPRVALEPSWFESRFPPPSVEGNDAGVLAHVVLTRSTLPWERSALRDSTDAEPWLAVLMITDQEAAGDGGLPAVHDDQVEVRSLRDPSPAGGPSPAHAAPGAAGPARAPTFPGLGPATEEPGQADADLVRVVDVPRKLLADLLPAASWLSTLTHVRERFVCTTRDELVDPADPAKGRLSAALDRAELPTSLRDLLAGHGAVLGPDARVRVEVPGAEWRIEGESTLYVERADPTADLTVTDEARAVVMGCRTTEAGQRYRAYLVSLEGRYAAGRSRKATGPEFDYAGAGDNDLVRLVVLDRWEFAVAKDADHLRELLAGLAEPGPVGLSVPTTTLSGPGVDMLRAGYALLPHRLRNGGSVRSWYRGPLVAHREDAPLPEAPHTAADALLLVDQATGIHLTSYAAAWELGRTLTTADPAVALDLVRWKAERRRHAHRLVTAAANPHVAVPPGPAPGLPPTVLSWLQRLSVLDGVPFGYLVPDPAMLPHESMRVFRLDPTWLDCLVDGAFSAGRLITASTGVERALLTDAMQAAGTHLRTDPAGPVTVSGCLIRSDVVSGWPALQVDGRSGETRHPVVRRARLSDNVLLVLFLGDVGRIDVHPNPEALHHGLTLVPAPAGPIWSIAPQHLDAFVAEGGPARLRPGNRNVLDVAHARQKSDGSAFTPDEFALRMLAGLPRLQVQVAPQS